MRRRSFLTLICAQTGAAIIVCSSSGCGMIFHPERRGQPHSHQIDWQIAALDGLCLLLFFVPGVIAFAVDFATGAIYLPHHEVRHHYSAKKLQQVPLPPEKQSMDQIQLIVSTHAGIPIDLQSEQARVSELATIDEFGQQKQKHEQNTNFGHKLRRYFTKPIIREGSPA